MKDINNIWKFLQRQLSSEEQQSLEQWKNVSEENLDLFNDVHELWTESENLDDIQLFNTEMNWAEIEDQIEVKKRPLIRTIQWVGIAASFILIVATLFWLNQDKDIVIEDPLYRTYSAVDHNEELKLPDSSIIYLEKGTSIDYFTRLDKDLEDRRIYLSGVATFDIASNDTLPFIVEASKTGVKALGTIFKVELKDTNDIFVENIEGLIKFYELQNEANAVTLKQGEKFNYNGESFVDKTPRVEKKVIKVIKKAYTIQELWYELLDKFENKVVIKSIGSVDPDATIRINLDQSLPRIIESLDSNSKIQIEYKQTCPDCYEIESLIISN